jgi:hypothetical protein
MFAAPLARIAGALLMVTLALAVGCGDGAKGPDAGDDAAEARAVIEAYKKAMHEGDWPKLYTLYDEQCRKECPLEEFLAAAELGAEFLTGLSIEVTNISVQGHTATAELMVEPSGWEATPNTWELVRQDGQWRLRGPPGTECCGMLNPGQGAPE